MIKMLNSDALVPSVDTVKDEIMKSFEDERKTRKILFQVRFYFYIHMKVILFLKLIYCNYLIEYSRQNFFCIRCMDINKWPWIFSYYNALDHKRMETSRWLA